jgi:AAA+ superfamily predicted ATPase
MLSCFQTLLRWFVFFFLFWNQQVLGFRDCWPIRLTTTQLPQQQHLVIDSLEQRNQHRNGLISSRSRLYRVINQFAPKSQYWTFSTLRKATSPDSNTPRPRRRIPNPIKALKATVTRVRSVQMIYWARFQSLSRKSKMIVLTQLFLVATLMSSVANKVYNKNAPPPPIEISYSSFLDLIEQKAMVDKNDPILPKLDQVRIGSDRILYRLSRNPSSDGSSKMAALELPVSKSRGKEIMGRILRQQSRSPYLQAYTRKVSAPPELVNKLRANDISFAAAATPRASTLAVAVRTFLAGFYFLFLLRLYRTISGGMGGGKNDSIGKLATNINQDLPRASFDEIQGIDDAKVEVMELVDVLRNPDKYAILGARAPTGLLLVGPPGTGKTMLARATAATAGVPLLYCSGSDFVEMFVGRGAARVRQLFDRAQKLAPCIIFIDELDALGKSRDFGSGMMQRSNDEAEQTLNQLLACMDGLDSSRQVCVLAATNRKEVLDPALVRPGRFDRIVKLELPNAYGRERILRVHASKLPGFMEGSGLDTDRMNALGKGRLVDLSAIAAVTDGFSGAELEFLVNEAAIRAVRRVSLALQQGTTAIGDIVPHVEAKDFEESLRSFYETRKPRGLGATSVNDILKNVWKQ